MPSQQHTRDPAPTPIRYLRRDEIDIVKWDACIRTTPDGLVYALVFFLDAITGGNWDALVLDDYAAVMPLTWKRKFGIAYLTQPLFCAVLGVFGRSAPAVLSEFLAAIPRRFRYWDIDLHEGNALSPPATSAPAAIDPAFTGHSRRPKITIRKNYFLPLDKPYETLQKRYRRLARRMLHRASAAQLSIERAVDPALVIDCHRKAYRHLYPDAGALQKLSVCARVAFAQGNATTYLARLPNREIAAFYLVFLDERNVYSVLGGSTAAGKATGAFYLLTDAAIRDHCPGDRVFRFEGSDVPGIALFNAQFGPYPVGYPHLTLNRLPFPINYLKPG
ncbi:MAG TPA: hypothetical protein VHE54_07010 [Puia sp.]|nr:hypothetical protein [Puia sp.]